MTKTPEQISYNMKQVHSKDSQIELTLRKALWNMGYRYRKNVKTVYGHPDIAFIGKKVAVFCDSEFWHGYDWDNQINDFKSRRGYWIPKIERNMERDREVNQKLLSDGWIVLRFWGKDIQKNLDNCLKTIDDTLKARV